VLNKKMSGLASRRAACTRAKFGNDEVLDDAFPHWEPYKKTIKNGSHPWSDTYYRYYGNAVFEHAPALTARGMEDIGAELENVAVADAGGLVVHNAPAGEVHMTFELPYIIADTEIEGTAQMEVGGGISFLFSTDDGKNWLLGGEVKESGKFGPISIGRPNTYEFPAGSTSGRYEFDLRIVVRCNWRRKPTVLKALKVTNTTMLNFYSRPWLETGTNDVTVTAGNPLALAKTPLHVTWCWFEDWQQEKTSTHTVPGSAHAITISRPSATDTSSPNAWSVDKATSPLDVGNSLAAASGPPPFGYGNNTVTTEAGRRPLCSNTAQSVGTRGLPKPPSVESQ
jgi:hypothetical protein